MPVYQFEAMNSQGKAVRDEVEAQSTDDALAKIRAMNLFPTQVKEKRGTARAARRRKKGAGIMIGGIRSKHLTTFTRQLSTLTDAGIPVVQSLNILSGQMRGGAFKNIVGAVAMDVEGGASLSEAMANYRKAFDELYVNMVRAGEVGGMLDVVLQRLAEFREKAQRLRRRVIGAMIYPACVITFAVGILIVIMIKVIPSFMDMFNDLNVTLPGPTKLLLAASEFVQSYWYVLLLSPIAFFGLYKLIRSTTFGGRVIDWLKFHVPVFGNVLHKGAIARFTRTFGTLIGSGVPILEALDISRETAGNKILADAIGSVHDSIREGDPISVPLSESGVCDDMVVNMIDVGEETGNLDTMLLKIADDYDDQVDTAVEGLTSAMEPVMVVTLGVIVGFIVISLFLPLIKLMESLS